LEKKLYKITLDETRHIISILEQDVSPKEIYDSIIEVDDSVVEAIHDMMKSGIELTTIIVNADHSLEIDNDLHIAVMDALAKEPIEELKREKKEEIKENFSNALKIFTTSFGVSINATMSSVTILDTLYRYCERKDITEVTIRDALNKPVVISSHQLQLAVDEAIGYIQKILQDRALAESELEKLSNEEEIESFETAFSNQKYEPVLPDAINE
jgi:aromatic ring-opening dioxygenase LigB subunit